MLWSFGELTSTISTTIRRRGIPRHAETTGKKTQESFGGGGSAPAVAAGVRSLSNQEVAPTHAFENPYRPFLTSG
jgi:hypothetical protein